MRFHILVTIVALLLILSTLILYKVGTAFGASSPERDPEGISPRGAEGGMAVPASGSSFACTLTLSPNGMPPGGGPVTLTWSGTSFPMEIRRRNLSCTDIRFSSRCWTSLGTHSSAWTDSSVSGLAQGEYRYWLWNQEVDGTGHPTDNYTCTAGLTIGNKPDLLSKNLQTLDGAAIIVQNVPTYFSADVENVGSADAAAFRDGFSFRYGSVAYTKFSTVDKAGLNAGQTSNDVSGMKTFNSLGTVTISHCVDDQNVISEFTGNNNCTTRDYQVVTTAALPDLVSDGLGQVGGYTASVPVNTALSFTARARNSSANALAGTFTDRFQYSTDGGASWSLMTNSPSHTNLAANDFTTPNETGGFTPASPATYTIRHCVDQPGNTITELNENNNCATLPGIITVTGGSSPVVTSCTPSAASIAVNGNVTWTANSSGGVSPWAYQWSGTDGLTGGGSGSGNTNTNGPKQYTTTGTKYAWVNVIDNLGLQSGLFACATLTVGAVGAVADLVASNLHLSSVLNSGSDPASIPIPSSGTLTLGFIADLQNTGSVDAADPGGSAFRNMFRYDFNNSGTYTNFDSGTSRFSLGANTQISEASIQINVPAGSTAVKIQYCGDFYDQVPEATNANNCVDKSYVLTAGGNLSNIKAQNLKVVPTGSIVAGSNVDFSADRLNGTSYSTGVGFAFDWSYSYNGPSGPFTSFESSPPSPQHGALGSGAMLTNTTGVLTPFLSMPGTVYIKYCADTTNVIPEVNESDNCATRGFTVTSVWPGAIPNCNATTPPFAVGDTVLWNIGGAAGGLSYPNTYYWRGSDGLTGTQVVSSPSASQNWSYTTPGTKNAEIRVVDNLGRDSGWIACGPVTVNPAGAGLPDLIPSLPSVSGSGATRTFTSTVANSGGSAASAFNSQFEVITKPGSGCPSGNAVTPVTLVNTNRVSSLNAGSSDTLTASTWSASPPADYCIRVVVDTSSNEVDEGASGEANNTSSWSSFTVAAPPAPSLSVQVQACKIAGGVLSGCTSGLLNVQDTDSVALIWSTSNAGSCLSGGFSWGNQFNNSSGFNIVTPPAGPQKDYTLQCTGISPSTEVEFDTASIKVTSSVAGGGHSLTCNPGRVTQGQSCNLTPNSGSDPGCYVTGTNVDPGNASGDGDGDVNRLSSFVDGSVYVTGPILGQTTFTLTCPVGPPIDTIVRILPTIVEE